MTTVQVSIDEGGRPDQCMSRVAGQDRGHSNPWGHSFPTDFWRCVGNSAAEGRRKRINIPSRVTLSLPTAKQYFALMVVTSSPPLLKIPLLLLGGYCVRVSFTPPTPQPGAHERKQYRDEKGRPKDLLSNITSTMSSITRVSSEYFNLFASHS